MIKAFAITLLCLALGHQIGAPDWASMLAALIILVRPSQLSLD